MVLLQGTVLLGLGGQGEVLQGACKWEKEYCDLALGVCPQEAGSSETGGGHNHEATSCPVDIRGS